MKSVTRALGMAVAAAAFAFHASSYAGGEVMLAQRGAFTVYILAMEIDKARCDGTQMRIDTTTDDAYVTQQDALASVFAEAALAAERRCPGLFQINVTGVNDAYKRAFEEKEKSGERRYIKAPYEGRARKETGWKLEGSAFDIATNRPIPPRKPGERGPTPKELDKLLHLADHDVFSVSVNPMGGTQCHQGIVATTARVENFAQRRVEFSEALEKGVRKLLERCPDLNAVGINGIVPGKGMVYSASAYRANGWYLVSERLTYVSLVGPSPRPRIGPSPCDGPGSGRNAKEPTQADMCTALANYFDQQAEAYKSVGAAMQALLGPLGRYLMEHGSLEVRITSFKKLGPCRPESAVDGGRMVCRYDVKIFYPSNDLLAAIEQIGIPTAYSVGAFVRTSRQVWAYDLTEEQKQALREDADRTASREAEHEKEVEKCRNRAVGTIAYWSCR